MTSLISKADLTTNKSAAALFGDVSPEVEQDVLEPVVTPLGTKPVDTDYETNKEYLAAIVEWLCHKEQLPVLLETKIALGNNELVFNKVKLNSKFTLVNEYNNNTFYRMDEINYCLTVLEHGVDKVNSAQVVNTATTDTYGTASSKPTALTF